MKKIFLFLSLIAITSGNSLAAEPDGMTTGHTEMVLENTAYNTAYVSQREKSTRVSVTTEIWEIQAPELEARSMHGTKRVALARHPATGQIREIPLDVIMGNKTSAIGSIPQRVKYAFLTFWDNKLVGVVFIFPMNDNDPPPEGKPEVILPNLLTATKP